MGKLLCHRCNHELIMDSQWMGSDVAAVPEEKHAQKKISQ